MTVSSLFDLRGQLAVDNGAVQDVAGQYLHRGKCRL